MSPHKKIYAKHEKYLLQIHLLVIWGLCTPVSAYSDWKVPTKVGSTPLRINNLRSYQQITGATSLPSVSQTFFADTKMLKSSSAANAGYELSFKFIAWSSQPKPFKPSITFFCGTVVIGFSDYAVEFREVYPRFTYP